MDDAVFSDLITQVQQGDERAIAHLLHAFEPEVRLMVRRRLPHVLRSQFDSVDFLQLVWTSVFVGAQREEMNFDNAHHFRAFLAGIVQNKVYQEYRKRTKSKKYQLSREEPLYVRRGTHEGPLDVPAPDPTPSQEAQANDRMAQLAVGRSPAEVRALELRRYGLTFEEIAAHTGMHERTVRRLIGELRDQQEARQWR